MARTRSTGEKVNNILRTSNENIIRNNLITVSNNLSNFLINALRDAIVNYTSAPINILTDKSEINFYNDCVNIKLGDSIEILKLSQKSNNWLNERRKRITASSCYELYTYNKSQHSMADWRKKTKLYFKPLPNIKNFSIGIENEPIARNLYEITTTLKVDTVGLVINPNIPWLGASPDGICVEAKKIIEIKCIVPNNSVDFSSELKKVSYLKYDKALKTYSLKKKHKYYAQVQMGMCVLNLNNCDFVVYSVKHKEFLIIDVSFDYTFTFELLASLHLIYFKYILNYIYNNNVTEAEKQKYLH